MIAGGRWLTELWQMENGDKMAADQLLIDVGLGFTHPLTERLSLGVDLLEPADHREAWRYWTGQAVEQRAEVSWGLGPDVRVSLLLGL